MADLQVKTANICNITSSTLLRPNAGGSGTYISDNTISVHMTNQHRASGIYVISLPEQSVIGGKYTISFVPVCATNNVMLVVLYGTTTQISFTSGNRYTLTITATAADNTMAFYGGDTVEKTIIIKDIQIEKGETATVYRPYSATGWLHSLRKLTTATEAVENPLYSDGTAITAYAIKGDTVQNGTPTPSNPVDVNGVGVRTENLTTVYSPNTSSSGGLNFEAIGDKLRIYGTASTYVQCVNTNDIILPSGTYTFSISSSIGGTGFYAQFRSADGTTTYATITNTTTITFNEATTGRIRVIISATESKPYATDEVISIMINEGSTAKPYEPYGYKIPISCGQQTTNIYLGSTQSTRQVKKLVLTGDEYWVYQANNLRFVMTINNIVVSGLRATPFFCTHYIPISDGRPIKDVPLNASYLAAVEPNIATLNIKIDTYTTAADFKAYLAAQYAAGTPVTVWYVLATAETAAVNEPLMKIGTYTDTLSNAASIPTTEGANSITVDTTVQPSEFTATWTGWHDATVKEAKHGNNLFDYTTMSVSDENSYLNSDGTIGTSNDWNITEYIPCDGTSFTIGDIGGNTPAICLYNANKEYITGKSYNTGGTYSKQAVNITSQTTAKFIRFSYCKGSLNPDDISAIMLNSGSTLLPYEPYSIHWE